MMPRQLPKPWAHPNLGSVAATRMSTAERTLRRILEFQDEADPRTPGTLVKALRESGESAAELYRAWAEILPKVLPRLDWSKPFYWDWNKEPEYYRDQHDLYAREVAPFLGEWDRLRDVLTRVDAGQISEAQGEREVRANAEAVRLAEREHGVAGGKPGPGRGHKTGSATTRFGRGSDYTLARLERDRPDLAERVRADETNPPKDRKPYTANAAAIEAGFRRKTWQAPDDIEQLAAAIERRYPDWQLTPRRKNGNA